MTFLEAKRLAEESLAPAIPIGESQAIAMELCLFVSGLDKKDREGQRGYLFQESATALLNNLLNRIVQGEPLQYVLEESWFGGLRLKVTPAVLIPRPETEELVEWVISHCKFPLKDLQIVDAGTGSGCIALALKKRLRKSTVTALDISAEALAIALENATESDLQVNFIQADILDRTQVDRWPFADIIVSNPPYIQQEERMDMDNRVVEYEPALALFVSQEDPLCHYRALGEILAIKGKEEAQLFCEMNAQLASQTEAIFQEQGFKTEIKNDMQGKPRMIRVYR